MDLQPEKLRIVIDIYRMEDINNQTIQDIGNKINQLFRAIPDMPHVECLRDNTPRGREVLVFDDVIGRQIKVNKNIYVIMLTSYKSLLTPEVANPWSWSRYWYGTQPIVKFIPNSSRAREIKDTADFHFHRSQMAYNPYLIIADVEESGKEEISQLFSEIGFSLSRIIFVTKNTSVSNDRLLIMVKMIEMKLWHEKC